MFQDLVHFVSDRETGRSRGFAFVTMGTPEEAAKAIEGMDGRTLEGRPLHRAEEPSMDGGPGGDEGEEARKDEGEEARKDEGEEARKDESEEDVDAIWLVVSEAWSHGLVELEALKSELQSLRFTLDSEVGE